MTSDVLRSEAVPSGQREDGGASAGFGCAAMHSRIM